MKIILISHPPVSILRTNRWAQWCRPRTTTERDYSTTTSFCIVAALASRLTHPCMQYNTYICPTINAYTLLHRLTYNHYYYHYHSTSSRVLYPLEASLQKTRVGQTVETGELVTTTTTMTATVVGILHYIILYTYVMRGLPEGYFNLLATRLHDFLSCDGSCSGNIRKCSRATAVHKINTRRQ